MSKVQLLNVNGEKVKDIKLNEAVEKYNKGLELSKFCYNTLRDAEKLIVKNADSMEDFKIE